MKNSISLFFFCMLWFNLAGQNINIKVKIKNAISRKIEIQLYPFAEKGVVDTLQLDENNEIEFKATINDIAYLKLIFDKDVPMSEGGRLQWYILEPNDEIKITFDAQNFWKTISYSGNAAAKFAYHKEDFTEIDLKRDWENVAKAKLKKSKNDFFQYLIQVEKWKFSLLEKYKSKTTPQFYTICEAEIKSAIAPVMVRAIYQEAQKKKIEATSLLIPTAYRAIFTEITPPQNTTTAKSMGYPFTVMYLLMLKEPTPKITFGEQAAYFFANKSKFHPAFAEVLGGELLESEINYLGATPELLEQVAAFEKEYPNSRFLKGIKEEIVKKSVFALGKPAMPFTLQDTAGRNVQLSDFKEKVIYLDFWASWCGPCIAEIKAAKKIKEQFKNQTDLVFLYISIDEKQSDWRKAIDTHQIGGTHLRDDIEDKGSVAVIYGSTCIPSSYIIGRTGEFYAIQPPAPSENNGKDLIDVLKSALR